MARTLSHELVKPVRELVTLQTQILKYCGIWQLEPKASSLLRWVYFVYKVSILSTMYILAITVFADLYSNFDNMSITTDDGCILAGIVVVIFKAMNYQFRWKKIKRLLEEILKCAEDLFEFSHVRGAKDIVNGYHVHIQVVFYGFNVLGCVLGILLLFFSSMEIGLPIRAKYPFDTLISPWQQIGFAIETVAVFSAVLSIVAMDSVMVSICVFIIMQFAVLNKVFENCGAQGDKCNSVVEQSCKGTSNNFVYRYKMCLKFHQRLISLFNDCNKAYNSSMFVQMLSSTSIICLTGFQAVVVGGQNSNIIKFGVYLSAATSQLLYICWIGNELSYSNSMLDRSQWFSNWHRERITEIAKLFTLSTMFARRSIKLTAGAFYILSLETFIAIIRRSYSVFTLLNNMHTENS